MKRFSSLQLQSVIALAVIVQCQMSNALTTFIPRGQGEDTARRLVGWQRLLYQCYEENYTVHASTINYTRSRDTDCLARKLFSTSCLTFAGSQSPNRAPGDVIADYFGLPTDFFGTLAIKPRIDNIIMDIDFYWGLDDISQGLYLRVNAPVTHTRWDLGLDECIACADRERGSSVFPDCYMNSTIPGVNTIPNPAFSCPVNTTLDPDFVAQIPLQNCNAVNPYLLAAPQASSHCIFKYNENCTTGSLKEALSGNFVFGDMQTPWKFGRFSFCPRSKTALADLEVSVGCNAVIRNGSHVSFFGTVVVPTGTKPKAHYIFEPIVGDGKHWQLGGGFTAHYSFWPDENPRCFNTGVYIDAQLTHYFKSTQKRSFDFRDQGLLSRYMLLKEFNNDNHYTGAMINGINFATRSCKVSVPLKADLSIKGYIAGRGWEFDLGYNFYFRAKERVCIKTSCPCPLDDRHFGIKGLEGVCCTEFTVDNDGDTGIIVTPSEGSRLLDTTQPEATLFRALLPVSAPVEENPSSICLSWNSPQITEDTPLTDIDSFIIANTQAVPRYVTCRDLDPSSAQQGALVSHKLFSHVNYTFVDSYYRPFVGIGGEIEWDGHHHNTLSQWGARIKFGLSF